MIILGGGGIEFLPKLKQRVPRVVLCIIISNGIYKPGSRHDAAVELFCSWYIPMSC